MKKIQKLETFEISECAFCGTELTEGCPYKVTFTDGSVSYVCYSCGNSLAKLLGVDTEKIPVILI